MRTFPKAYGLLWSIAYGPNEAKALNKTYRQVENSKFCYDQDGENPLLADKTRPDS